MWNHLLRVPEAATPLGRPSFGPVGWGCCDLPVTTPLRQSSQTRLEGLDWDTRGTRGLQGDSHVWVLASGVGVCGRVLKGFHRVRRVTGRQTVPCLPKVPSVVLLSLTIEVDGGVPWECLSYQNHFFSVGVLCPTSLGPYSRVSSVVCW